MKVITRGIISIVVLTLTLSACGNDDEAGGMQGLMEPWARAIRARGGEIALGWKPVEIVVDDGRVRGGVAVDTANLVGEVAAPVAPVAPELPLRATGLDVALEVALPVSPVLVALVCEAPVVNDVVNWVYADGDEVHVEEPPLTPR